MPEKRKLSAAAARGPLWYRKLGMKGMFAGKKSPSLFTFEVFESLMNSRKCRRRAAKGKRPATKDQRGER